MAMMLVGASSAANKFRLPSGTSPDTTILFADRYSPFAIVFGSAGASPSQFPMSHAPCPMSRLRTKISPLTGLLQTTMMLVGGVSREQIWTSVGDEPRNELRVERCECYKLQVKVLSVHQSLLITIRCSLSFRPAELPTLRFDEKKGRWLLETSIGDKPRRYHSTIPARPKNLNEIGCAGALPEHLWQRSSLPWVIIHIAYNCVTTDAIAIVICSRSAWIAPPVVFGVNLLA